MTSQPHTVLIAEDNPVERKLLSLRLSQMGYKVVAAADGMEALERTRASRPDLILSDVLMPRLDGFRLCQTLRRDPEFSGIPVVLTSSATIEEDDRLLALEMGASAFVARTPDCRDIIEAVQSGLVEGAPPLPTEDEEFRSELRQRFLSEGSTEVRMLLDAVETAWDAAAAGQLAHRWAGVGGTLGFAQISQLAQQIENLCQRPPGESADELRLRLMELLNLFSDAARVPSVKPQTPAGVLEVLSGKCVALVGFTGTDATLMSRVLEQAGAQPYCLGWQEAPPGSAALAPADLVILLVEPSGKSAAWNDPRALAAGDKPLLVVGSREALFRTGASARKYSSDFVLDPWSSEEVLLRASRVLRRSRHVERQAGRAGPTAPVLIVDDDPTVCMLVSEALGSHGLPCQVAGNGVQALEMAASLRPSLLILDINLPDMDGFQVLMRLQREPLSRNLPVVLLSVRQQEADVLRGFALGAADYVTKPFGPLELVARVRRLLRD